MALQARKVPGSFEKQAPGHGHCNVFLGKVFYFHNASLHSGIKMGTNEFYAGDNLAMDWHYIQGGEEIHPVALCYRNRDNL